MQTKEYRTVDKSGWIRGEWDVEPDKKQWQDPGTGLPCLIVRNHGGALCGYVGVAPGHPLHGMDYNDVPYEVHDAAHGGLTFSGGCQPGADESRGICHVPDKGEPDHVWWLGFDCAHCDDMSPAHEHDYRQHTPALAGRPYRMLGYVERRVRELASAIASTNGRD